MSVHGSGLVYRETSVQRELDGLGKVQLLGSHHLAAMLTDWSRSSLMTSSSVLVTFLLF